MSRGGVGRPDGTWAHRRRSGALARIHREHDGSGVASYLSAPLAIGKGQAGALSLYSVGDRGFTVVAGVRRRCRGAVWNGRGAEQWREEVAGLREAMKTRAVIEQAKGMLMVAHGADADRAFEMLVE